MKSHLECGLFELTGPQGYVPLSGQFLRKNQPILDDFMGQGVVDEKELTLPVKWGKLIWNDSKTGSTETGSAWAVDTGALDDDSAKILVVPEGKDPAFLFHASNKTNQAPNFTPQKLDLSKCKLLKNKYVQVEAAALKNL